MSRQLQRGAGVWVVALAWFVLAGCERRELTGPPVLRLGRDECAECGMMINEERSASALLIERASVREHALFDDLGCMIDYERDRPPDVRILDRFAHDHVSRAWFRTEHAVFLRTTPDKLPTPMGSGIAAFSDRAAAAAAQSTLGGRIVRYDEL
ncbi:MAG: nitrous oxide reductase accessory protein NosL [Planctomycetota bacterium]